MSGTEGSSYASTYAAMPSRSDIEAIEQRSKQTNLFAKTDGSYWKLGQLGWLWCLLFGGFYFAYHRVWVHFFISWLAAICTFGISWLIYPIFARGLVRKRLLREGFLPVGPG